MVDDVVSIIQVPIAVLIIIALFFIAYFVIRLILRSRVSYFSILRMLGLARKNIRRILDVEMFTVINIAYMIFLAVVVLVNMGMIHGGICQDAGGISPGDGLCDPVCNPHRNGISHIRKVCKKPV